MMRPINILSMAFALTLLPCAGFADNYDDCRQTCATEKETRNMDCPSPYDAADSDQVRRKCIKANQDAYVDCIHRCPTPAPRPSSEEQNSSPAMAY